jgi:hypothetical protein
MLRRSNFMLSRATFPASVHLAKEGRYCDASPGWPHLYGLAEVSAGRHGTDRAKYSRLLYIDIREVVWHSSSFI